MTLLLVDDQLNVINGLLNGIDYQKLHIDAVLSATSVQEARMLINGNHIDILMSDIEMPGENGLQLLHWVNENHPDIVCILLTSHADFSYAQEGIKLGCFDYVVQPAPYQEIEEALMRAIVKVHTDAEKKQYYKDGLFYTNHKQELTDRTILNLFSQNPANRQQALTLLNEIHYPLTSQSCIRLIVLDIYPLSGSSNFSLVDLVMRQQISASLKSCGIDRPIYNLITLNTYKRFVIILFTNGNELYNLKPSVYEVFYEQITERICPDLSVYIGNFITLPEIRPEVYRVDTFVENNVNKKPALYFTEQEKKFETSLDVSDNITHWNRLLNSGQFDNLLESILSYLEFISSINVTNLKTLCDLHPQLTQIFFIYAYQHDIDVTSLFTKNYSYNEYMDAFKNTSALRKAMSFIIPAVHSSSEDECTKDAVTLAKDYIAGNVSLNLSVKDVADYVHLSPEYFTKLFKKEVGQNIKNYILQVKVDVAKDLLGNPNIPISMIALDLGYSNFSHFTQVFKKFEGITPTDYRKNILDASSDSALSS